MMGWVRLGVSWVSVLGSGGANQSGNSFNTYLLTWPKTAAAPRQRTTRPHQKSFTSGC